MLGDKVLPIPTHACLQATDATTRGAILSFPHGSAGGPDMLRPQHIKELIGRGAGEAGTRLLSSITRLSNLMLAGTVPGDICPLLYGASLCALSKKDGGIRPIAIGNIWRRLSAKIGCCHIKDSLGRVLQPVQLGFGTPGGAEAAAHAARSYVNFDHDAPRVFLKIDFLNAFNLVDRNQVLQRTSELFPELYPFVAQCYASASHLSYGKDFISSSRGVQQGDPLGPALFCAVVHPLAKSLSSELNIWFLDDATLGGSLEATLRDFQTIVHESEKLGLEVNTDKCELFVIGGCHGEKADIITAFKGVAPNIRTPDWDTCSLLGAPLVSDAIEDGLDSKSRALSRISDKLSSLQSHVGFYILKNCLAIPKLSYLLRCTPTWKCGEGLNAFDRVLREALEKVCNVKLEDNAWNQSALPTRQGGLGIKRAALLAVPAFLASIHSVKDLVRNILPPAVSVSSDLEDALQIWTADNECDPPSPTQCKLQKAWEAPILDRIGASLYEHAATNTAKARLLSVASSESGAFLNALPSASLGTLLDDQVFRVAVSLRLGSPVCQAHLCVCGSPVDSSGVHGLSCVRGVGRRSRHAEVNDILRRGLVSAAIPAILEPSHLAADNNTRPDGMTLIPWSVGRSLVWDFTCSDSLANCHVNSSALETRYAARIAEDTKKRKYAHLTSAYVFAPVAAECLGSFGLDSLNVVKEIGRRISVSTGDTRSTEFLIQRISVAIQRGNAACVLGTIPPSASLDELFNRN